MKYRLIGLDLDGTLLREDSTVSPRVAAAIDAAQQAGATVVPVTGRTWREARRVLKDTPQLDLGIFLTGAHTARLSDGHTHDAREIPRDLLEQVLGLLWDLPQALLVFRDPDVAGYEYMITGGGEIQPETYWWFEHNGTPWQEVRELEDNHHDSALRLSVVGFRESIEASYQRVIDELGDAVETHHFETIPAPDGVHMYHLLEVFPAGVTKWTALERLAQEQALSREQIAVVGDQVNDLPMLREAGLSVAMGNAQAAVKDVANRVTASNQEDGVAVAIENMLEGKW
ncbi:Cof-type HAD-IIB family hydrolase [Mucisphaera sp.]|uniref:Cof-type HAD-IIB family hydrolase n=1 Tax=Mucisphaera sp. TaxID=2913024 RepID=UPI003D0D4A5C